ncbi:MAG: hypothetical protein OXI48_11680, partial [bacterium]|nr:hypothetical protein [bacterium]
PAKSHWQITLNINTALRPDTSRDELVHLLRGLINRIDDGMVGHITQTTMVSITGEQADADTLVDLAQQAGISVAVTPI